MSTKYSTQYLTYIKSIAWRKKSKKCRDLNRNRCVLYPWLKSNHTHHLHYRNLESELPIRDTVPLSEDAHNLIHLTFRGKQPFWGKSRLRQPMSNLLRGLFIISILFNQTIGRLIFR
jgi:hypothetical protein